MSPQAGEPWIKICGLRDPGTARSIANLNINAVGLNRYPDTHRYVTLEQARELAEAVRAENSSLAVVGLYVDESLETISNELETVDFDFLQLHGNESPQFVEKASELRPVIKAIHLPETGEADWESYSCRAHLFDHYDPDKVGGTGERAPWERLRRMTLPERWILAGGLTPDNVRGAVERLRPWGVDVASGVESADGTKDLVRVRSFVDEVRSTVSTGNRVNF